MEVRNARALGFSGKSCIHPSQIPVVHRLYTPDEEEVAHARQVMEAMRAAEQAGTGVFTVDGKMVDAPVIAKARRVLLQIGEEMCIRDRFWATKNEGTAQPSPHRDDRPYISRPSSASSSWESCFGSLSPNFW